jgi:hypothetical protein
MTPRRRSLGSARWRVQVISVGTADDAGRALDSALTRVARWANRQAQDEGDALSDSRRLGQDQDLDP